MYTYISTCSILIHAQKYIYKKVTLDIVFRQISTFIKACVGFLIDIFLKNLLIKGSGAQNQSPHEVL